MEKKPVFSDFRNAHEGQPILVVGCGPSAKLLPKVKDITTIGVNDVGIFMQPTYLLVIDPSTRFKGGRWQYVEDTEAEYVFTHLPRTKLFATTTGRFHEKIVHFHLNERKKVTIDGDKIPFHKSSPFVAVGIAAYMGSKNIGVIGVDFKPGGISVIESAMATIEDIRMDTHNKGWKLLAGSLKKQFGADLWNLSPDSRLTSIPKMELETWLSLARQGHGARSDQE